MSQMFSGNTTNELFGVKVNSSDLGKPLTVVLGTAKTNQLLFWVDGFSQQPDGKKGGGKGGGKSGQYIYYADVVAALCAGPISGIGSVWTGQTWLQSTQSYETYAIAGPNYTYTPTNASTLANDYGVSPTSTYSGSYNDYSAPGSTSVSNTTSVAYQRVPYGTTLNAGMYSVNPANNSYNFSAADAGTTVQLAYSYSLVTINNQETDLVPANCTILVDPQFTFNTDLGVTYANTGTNSDADNALTRVQTPTAKGEYSVSAGMPATYTFSSADVGAAVTITYQVTNLNQVSQFQNEMLDFTLASGEIGQQPYSFLTGSFPAAALGYSGAATLLFEPMDLGAEAEVQQNSFEIITPDMMGGTYADGRPILDCNPVHCIVRVLTDAQWGLGVGAQPFPVSVIDNGTGGTWGAPGTPSVQQIGPTAWNWFAANNFLISPVIDSQDSAASAISKWLEAGMCAAYVSEGMLKLAPYGDTTTAANGCTWTAPSTYVVALDDTCFVAKEGADPVSIKRSAWQDAYNEVQVQWANRNNQYAKEITAESDQSLIDRFGSRIEDPQDWGFIHTLPAATFAANLRLKHGTYIRNRYEFSLPFNYSYLEPMDLVTITTSSVWAQGLNNTNLGVTNLPVRITKIEDDPTTGIKIEAEDYPFGAGQPTLFNKGQSAAEIVSNAYSDPGTSEVVLFEAAGRLVGYGGNQIWIGACGTSRDYGSTNVWASQDGVNYVQVAQLEHPAVIGSLAAVFPAGSDPDTTDSLVVALVENAGALASGTTQAADNDTMLCYVDGEVISYSAAAITGQNTYTLNGYIRRGQLGTSSSSHAVGSLFMRLDGSIFKYTYDPTWQGKTIYFKFQAVNNFGNNPQPLTNLTALSFNISSTNGGAIDAATGLIEQGSVAGLPGTITGINNSIALAQSEANAAQSLLNTLSSTSVLTPGEKASIITDYNTLIGAQTANDLQAAAANVSHTAYDSAISALTTYLGTLTSPVAWNDTTNYTTIDGSTFSSTFETAYSAQNALLNSISSAFSSASISSIPVNLVPDSNLQFGWTYWNNPNAGWSIEQVVSANPSPSSQVPGCNAFVIPASSNSAGFNHTQSAQITLTAGQQYTMSGFIDAYYVTAGSPVWALYDKTATTLYANIYATPGTTGRFNTTFTFSPSGIATGTSVQVVLLFDTADSTFTNEILASAPMIQPGNTMTAYIAGVASLNSQSGLEHGAMSSAVQSAVTSAGNVNNLGGVAASSITPISNLMPAQAGADVTALNTAGGTATVDGLSASHVANATLSTGLVGKWWRMTSTNPFPTAGGDLPYAPTYITRDAQISYNIATYPYADAVGSPFYGQSTDYVYVRWTGYYICPTTGTYTFGVNSDDGANLYVNGAAVFPPNLSASQPAAADLTYTQSGTVSLTAGDTYEIILEYRNGTGGALIQLLTTPPGGSVQLLSVGAAYSSASLTQYASGVAVETLQPAQAGADVTSLNTSANSNQLGGVAAGSITPIAGFVDGGASTLFTKQGSIAGALGESLSYSTATTSIELSWAAFAIYFPSGAVFNVAASNYTWSGLTAATTYYLCLSINVVTGAVGQAYCSTTAATTQYAVQNSQADNWVAIALNSSIATPSSGGGGGTTTTPSCADITMYVRPDLQVGDCCIGDVLDCVDGEHPIQADGKYLQPCVRIITAAGHELIVSRSTPFTLPDGSSLYAYQMDGQMVLTDTGHNTPKVWMQCAAEDAGERMVNFLSLGGRTFAAGKEANMRIYSHNYLKA